MTGITWPGADGLPQLPFKRLFTPVKRAPRDGAQIVTAYTDGQVTLRSNRAKIGYHEAADTSTYLGVLKGDFVVHGLDIMRGSVGVSDSDGVISPVCIVCVPTPLIEPRYAAYAMRLQAASGFPKALARGVREGGADFRRWDTLAELPLPVPRVEQQRAIADYLDRETAQIDAFIAKNEELITLLTERRAAVIGRAVTRGLDERADCLTKGPDWIGSVPAHWTVQPIKRGYSVVVGKMLNESMSVGELVPYVRAANIQPGGLDLGNVKEMRATAVECKALALRAGDVVFVEGGGGYGRSDFLSDDLPGWVFQNHVIRLRPRPGQEGRFLNYWLQHVRRLGHYEALSAFATIPNVSGDKLGRIEMPVPPLVEQCRIVAQIEEATTRIDDALAVADRSVELARERRAALISAAVTGKINVGVAA
ncbi:restriction endonuclease subunit S [Curtobacterium sp. NPDC098951]|uniref:restriction endonuclease subunit S n=1 Tax=Curtobacterium sp. NPDC098951 TaxID=3363974 RepID=UPI0038134E16